MKTVSLFLLIILQTLFFGCSKNKNIFKADLNKTSTEQHYVVDNLILSIGSSKKLISFNLNLYGEGSQLENVPGQKDLVKNILANNLSGLEISEIKSQNSVNKRLVHSFNQFFADVKISKLEISKLREL